MTAEYTTTTIVSYCVSLATIYCHATKGSNLKQLPY